MGSGPPKPLRPMCSEQPAQLLLMLTPHHDRLGSNPKWREGIRFLKKKPEFPFFLPENLQTSTSLGQLSSLKYRLYCYIPLQALWTMLAMSSRHLAASLNRKFLKAGTHGNLPHAHCRPAHPILLPPAHTATPGPARPGSGCRWPGRLTQLSDTHSGRRQALPGGFPLAELGIAIAQIQDGCRGRAMPPPRIYWKQDIVHIASRMQAQRHQTPTLLPSSINIFHN